MENVTRSYGTLRAVDGLSIEIRQGETFGLLGPNGAGKSTSISLISGLQTADSGTVRVLGGSPRDQATRMRVGVAPQSLALYDELSARENLAFFGRMYGLNGALLTKRMDWALDLAGLADRARERVTGFSGGMKRRLNIAIAMVHDPELILLDEPTVGVDPQSRNFIFETIGRLGAEGRTVLYTTHYMEEAERLCTRVAIIDLGRVCAIGSVEELVAAHGGKSSVEAEIQEVSGGVQWPGTLDGSKLRFDSERPLDEISRLYAAGVQFRSLNMRRPGLEQVFLNLTGKVLRD